MIFAYAISRFTYTGVCSICACVRVLCVVLSACQMSSLSLSLSLSSLLVFSLFSRRRHHHDRRRTQQQSSSVCAAATVSRKNSIVVETVIIYTLRDGKDLRARVFGLRAGTRITCTKRNSNRIDRRQKKKKIINRFTDTRARRFILHSLRCRSVVRCASGQYFIILYLPPTGIILHKNSTTYRNENDFVFSGFVFVFCSVYLLPKKPIVLFFSELSIVP